VGLLQPHATGTMAAVTRSPSSNAKVRLDDVSMAIIELLQEDGRQSYATIAKRVARRSFT
jgi:Lrp/AsnC family transcriptional regulator for asnA, asnC and gidA